jgi:tetratricopeptide (TPR) repeat protein
VEARIALADALAKAGEPQQAEREYREALSREPLALRASFNLGVLLQQAGRNEEAMEQFRRVLKRHPDDYRARMNLGLLSARAGRHQDAAEHFAWLVQTTGDLPARVQLAEAYVALGSMAAAFDEYRIVLREPSAAWAQVAGRVAWLLATHPEAEVRDGRQALQLSLEACRQTNHQRPDLLRSLAAAYAETGDYAMAEQTARRAQALASGSGKQEFAEQIATDRQHYAAGQPVRAPPGR